MNKIINFDINVEIEDSDKVSQIEETCKDNRILSVNDINILLRNLSYFVRKQIADYEGKNMTEYSYSNKCDLAQSMICHYLMSLGIKVNPVNTNQVIPGVCGHSLVLAFFETPGGEKVFLLDPTYLQFFDRERCDSSRFIVIENKVCVSPDPGFFIAQSKTGSVILPILKDGFIEFTDEVAKAYGDSFFQTKQGTTLEQIKNNVARGADYRKWFQYYTSTLSKSEEELKNMNLLIGFTEGSRKK